MQCSLLFVYAEQLNYFCFVFVSFLKNHSEHFHKSEPYKAKKNKSYVSKPPRAFVFRCAFDSAKFKVWIFLLASFFFSVFYDLFVKKYKKRYDRHNETLWTTDFFNFCVLPCILFIQNQVPYFKAVTDSNLTRLLLKKEKKKNVKKNAFRSGLPICHELWDIAFIFFSLIQMWVGESKIMANVKTCSSV